MGIGAGAQSWRPLGVAVVGGLAISQVITLYITQVVYTYFDELQGWLSRRRLARTVPQEARSTTPRWRACRWRAGRRNSGSR
ncbi:MAG TPA: efflux RND transporter permease subunit [Longimicrobiaceae bacterium]|nr:efflux RND transporter permease subunit [Longimicrobiaceae bacterium]